MTTQDFKNFNQTLRLLDYTMPALFIGHGSPMNGIEDNDFSQRWKGLAKEIPVPTAVIVISAHWFTKGTHITAMEHPETIHDFGGFPKELFSVQYPAPGSPSLAQEAASMVHTTTIDLAHDWGLDHGTWTVVRHMYPEAKIPVLQLSIDYTKAPQYHYDLAKELTALRKKGVLIIGSGNMVHNLRLMSWDMIKSELGYDWANEMNTTFKNLIINKEHSRLIQYEKLGKDAMMAIPTPEHYLPLIYSLALQGKSEEVSFFNDKAVGGSLTMTSVKIGS